MICLAVNTATSMLSIALLKAGEPLGYFETGETRDQGNLLIRHIETMLSDNGLSYADVHLLAAVTGPGSFTGIRIGLAAMRGISLAANIPIVGVSSFEMFSKERVGCNRNIIVVESWREELYFQLDDLQVNETPERFAKRIKDISGSFSIYGDAREKIAPFLPEANVAEELGNALDVGRIALQKKDLKAEKPVPFYLREADITMPKAKSNG
jgi:tRNA threonylcarbamoyl adenosine modification protein YeaZ